MAANERVTLDMISEYELGYDETVELKAYAVLDYIYVGMPKEQTYRMFGVNEQQVADYVPKWERLRKHVYAHH